MNEYEVTVLLASSSEKTREAVSRELVQKGFSVAGEVKTAGEARQFMEYSTAELVILDLPLKDSPGLEPAYDLGENEFTQVLVLAKNDVYDDNSAALAATLCLLSFNIVAAIHTAEAQYAQMRCACAKAWFCLRRK